MNIGYLNDIRSDLNRIDLEFKDSEVGHLMHPKIIIPLKRKDYPPSIITDLRLQKNKKFILSLQPV